LVRFFRAKTGSNRFWLGSNRFWLGFLGFGLVFSGFGSVFFGLARFWLGFLSVSVRFGFFGFLFIKPKLNRTGWFFQKINRFFFPVRFFRLIFSSFLGLIGFPVFLLTPIVDY
jgi:hypothetical protein